ncbi:MAG: anion permease [Candidatus Altiarchaeota archaeon]|nr:anion permease [Candidatus Altiarchaeota archaeon]
MDAISLSIVVSALLVGLNIGANSASNAIGVIVGSNIMSFRKAALLASISMLLGALLQGGAVIQTIGGDIVPLENGMDEDIALAALLATLIFVGISTALSIPVATSHTMVGAIMGIIIVEGLAGKLNFILISKLLLSWIMTPIAAIVLAVLLYRYVMTPLSGRLNLLTFSRLFQVLLVLGSVFLSYSLGANNIGNAVGPVIGSNAMSNQLAIVFMVGVSMGVGASSFSRRVVETVSKGITSMGPIMAFTSQFAAASVVYFFTVLGIPISSTQAVVGSVIGIGLTKGVRTVNIKTVEYISVGWVLTPVMAGSLSALIYWLLQIL